MLELFNQNSPCRKVRNSKDISSISYAYIIDAYRNEDEVDANQRRSESPAMRGGDNGIISFENAAKYFKPANSAASKEKRKKMPLS